MRRWLLLELCSFADPVPAPAEAAPEEPGKDEDHIPMRAPTEHDPFLVMKKGDAAPSFGEALPRIAKPLKLSFEVWGDTKKLPATRIVTTHLQITKWPVDSSFVLGQESWSKKQRSDVEYDWGVRFFGVMGRRASYSNVSFPEPNRKDGVYFFVFNQRLYVWPKARMDAGVIRLLHVAGMMDDETLAEWEQKGFGGVQTTLTGP